MKAKVVKICHGRDMKCPFKVGEIVTLFQVPQDILDMYELPPCYIVEEYSTGLNGLPSLYSAELFEILPQTVEFYVSLN